MIEKGVRVMGSREKKKKPLFTHGEGAKRVKSENLWNIDERKYFANAKAKWREIYNDEEKMKIIYNKWELWIETCRKQIKIGDGSQKTLMSVLGTWFVTKVVADDDSDMEEEEDSRWLPKFA